MLQLDAAEQQSEKSEKVQYREKNSMIELKGSHLGNSENRRVQGPWRVTQTQCKPPSPPPQLDYQNTKPEKSWGRDGNADEIALEG